MNDGKAENKAKIKALDDAVAGEPLGYIANNWTVPPKPLSLDEYQELMQQMANSKNSSGCFGIPVIVTSSFEGAPRLAASRADIYPSRDPLADLHQSFQAALDALPISIEAAHREYAKVNRRYVLCFRLIQPDGEMHAGAFGLQSGGMPFAAAYEAQYVRQRHFARHYKNAKVRFWLEVVS